MMAGEIKLNEFRDNDKAWGAVVRFIEEMHRGNQRIAMPTSEMVLECRSPQGLYNAILGYSNGAKICVAECAQESRDSCSINVEFIASLLEGIDFDLSADEIQRLDPNHPFIALREIARLKDTPASSREFTPLNAKAAVFIKQLSEHLSREVAEFDLHPNTRVKNVEGTDVILTDDVHDSRIPASLMGREQGNTVQVTNLEAPDLRADAERAAEFRKREMMLRSANYHDGIVKVARDFVEKPNRSATDLAAKVMAARPNVPVGEQVHVTVVGLGPAGLYAAIRAYQEGAKVTAIDKRESYSRNNVFRLTQQVVDQIIELYVDKPEEIAALPADHPLKYMMEAKSLTDKKGPPTNQFYAMSTKDYELIASAWLELMAKQDPANLQVLKGYTYVPSIQTKLQEPNSIACRPYDRNTQNDPYDPAKDKHVKTDILIGCDGYTSLCRQDCGIGVDKHSTDAHYATFTYHTPRKGGDDLFASLQESSAIEGPDFDMVELKRLGWTRDSKPVLRYFTTGDHPYIGVEVPEALAKENDRLQREIRAAQSAGDHEKVLNLKEERNRITDEWGRACLTLVMPKANIDDLVLKESAMFPVQLQRAQKNNYHCQDGRDVVLIGDALQSAHFQTGQGAIKAVEESFLVGECIRSMVQDGTPKQQAIAKLSRQLNQKSLQLHELAFHFPSGEDLKVRPTREFDNFRADTRVEAIEDGAVLRAESGKEATAKATVAVKRFNF